MRSTLICLAAASCLLLACRTEPLSPPGGDDGGADDLLLTGLADLSTANACGRLTACQCLNTRGCLPISTACWCPFPDCGPGACACGGGAFLACVPATGCTPPGCRLVDSIAGPDLKGCYRCQKPADCAAARARLQTACQFSEAWIGGLVCDKRPDCVFQCLSAVNVCTDVGCDFCTTCDCAGTNNALARCYRKCTL